MENEFQTSFIPKRPSAQMSAPASPVVAAPSRRAPVGIVTLLSVLIFVASLVALGGVYFYKQLLTKQVVEVSAQLARAKEAFEPGLITELQTLDHRLSSASEILRGHITVSPILKTLQDVTLKSIRYTKFSYTVTTSGGAPFIEVKMTGQSRGYMPIALQNEAFAGNKYIKSPIFSNLILDDRTGNVLFDLTFSVDPEFVRYGAMPTQ